MSRYRIRIRRGDEGAILIFALIIITTIALVTGVVLTRGQGSLQATVTLRGVAGTSFSGDAAAQVALNALRTDYWDGTGEKPDDWAFANEVGDGCFGRNSNESVLEPDNELLLADFYPASNASGETPTSAYIECVAEESTGAQGTTGRVNPNNSPGDALITLGAGGEDGVYNFNKPLKVRGSVRSNSNINAKKEMQVVDANVYARTGCSGTIKLTAGYTKNCSAGSVTDPNYLPDTATLPPLRTVPACAGSYVAFEPGFYNDARALETITKSCNKIIWFKPGVYYFDFHNDTSNGDPLGGLGMSGAGSNQWEISKPVIGGTPINAAGNPIAAPVGPMRAPNSDGTGGMCANPVVANSNGVQFIFGGDSRIYFSAEGDNGTQLCGTYHTNKPPIVIYQNKTGGNPGLVAGTSMTPSEAPTVTAGGSTETDGTFVDPTLPEPGDLVAATLLTSDGRSATWQRSNENPAQQTRTIAMSGFEPASPILAGATLKEARLIVRHTEDTAPSVIITPNGAAATGSVTVTRRSSMTTDTITFNSSTNKAGYNALVNAIYTEGWTGASIDYSVKLGKNKSALLDSVALEFDYYEPMTQMRGPDAIPNNCVTKIGGCAIISDWKKAVVFLQGTTYVPLGLVDIEISNTDIQMFRWGLITRAFHANINGAYSNDHAVIELPDNSPGYGIDGTIVQMNVYVCPNSSTCDNSGPVALKVRAQLWDESGSVIPGERQVTVLNWSHQR